MIGSILRTSSIVLAFALMACSHHERPVENSNAPGASAPARELSAAVNDIATARCDLEQRCNNIGANQSFDNREACETKMRGSLGDDLNTKDCPHGVEHGKLSACLSQIQAEECGSAMDSMSRWNACRTGEICAE